MKFTKKTLAIVIALAIVLTSISIAVFADTEGTVTARTVYNRYDSTTGTYCETEYAKAGDTIRADIYLKSDFTAAGMALLLAYNSKVFTPDNSNYTEISTGKYSLVVPSDLGLTGNFKDGTSLANSCVSSGYVTADQLTDKGFYYARLSTYTTHKYNDQLVYSFYFTVNSDVTSDLKGTFGIFPDTTMTGEDYDKPSEVSYYKAGTEGVLSTAVGTKDYLSPTDYTLTITDAATELNFNGKAVFDANGGTFADGSSKTEQEGAIGAAATAPVNAGDADVDSKIAKEGYEFKGWATTASATAADATAYEIGTLTHNATTSSDDYTDSTYYAVWAIKSYTVKFVDDDGTILQSGTVKFGETPAYSGEKPTKASTYQYTYEFASWTPTIVPVEEDATYTATYTPTTRNYTVKFIDDDGITVLQSSDWAYGATPVYSGETPTKAATDQYTYTFAGWDKTVDTVKGDATYTATYTEETNKYTVIFKNYDGTVLQSSDWAYGATPVYSGETPTKAATDETTYTFDSWTPAIDKVTGEATYTATYKEKTNQYTVTFKNDDGTVLESSDWDYGATPSYSGETPTKAATADTTYTFDSWTPAIEAVKGDATYTATYKEAARTYTITFTDADGNPIQATDVAYGDTPVYTGETPTKASDDKYDYTFAGWEPEIAPVTGEATYKPVFTSTPIPATVTYTFNYIVKNDDGTSYVIGTPETQTGKEGTTYTVPGITAPEGYSTTATQWATEDGTVADGTFGSTSAIYMVECTPNKYTLTIEDKDGNVIGTEEVTFGSEIPTPSTDLVPAEITNEDGTISEFRGWESDPAGYQPGEAMPATPITLKPIYSARQTEYTATFYKDADKTELYTVEDVTTGEAIPDPGTPCKFGYKFAGWENADGYTVGGQMPAQDVEFTAKWELDKELIAIVVGGVVIGGGIAGTVAAVNTALITGAAIVGGVVVIGGAIVLADNTHKVTYYVDGEVYKTFYVIEGTKVIVPSDPTKSGYTFAGWDEEIPDAMPDHDISFNATWTAGDSAAAVDGNIPYTGSATAGISALAIIASAAAAAYVITTRKKDDED